MKVLSVPARWSAARLEAASSSSCTAPVTHARAASTSAASAAGTRAPLIQFRFGKTADGKPRGEAAASPSSSSHAPASVGSYAARMEAEFPSKALLGAEALPRRFARPALTLEQMWAVETGGAPNEPPAAPKADKKGKKA